MLSLDSRWLVGFSTRCRIQALASFRLAKLRYCEPLSSMTRETLVFRTVSTGLGDRVADFHVGHSPCCPIFENGRLREAVSDKGIFFGLEWARGVSI
jgi:hypothetical protein